MDEQKVTFPTTSYVYLIGCVLLFLASPLFVTAIDARHERLTPVAWLVAAIVSALFLVLLMLSHKYVTTDRLSYREGLLYIASYCRTGWVYNTLAVVAPVLMFSFVYVAFLSTTEMISRKRGFAAIYFYRLIMFMYNHRAIQ